MNKKTLIISMVGFLTLGLAVGTELALTSNISKGEIGFSSVAGLGYGVTFDSDVAISDGVATAKTGANNNYSISVSGGESYSGAFVELNTNGEIHGSTPIKGLMGVTVVFDEGGALKVGFGNLNNSPIAETSLTSNVRLATGYANGAAYFSIVATADTIIRSISLDYDCVSVDSSVSSLRVDSSKSKIAYVVGDTAESSDFAVYATFGLSGEQRLDQSKYGVSLDTSSEGTKAVTVTYLDNPSITTTYNVKVGSYDKTGADIAVVDSKAVVTVSGTFSSFTQEEFESLDWHGDFKYNSDPWNAHNFIPAMVTGVGTWSYSVDVTSYEEHYYAAHLLHKAYVEDGPNDLKINALSDYTKLVTAEGNDYLLNYNLRASNDDAGNCFGLLGLRVCPHHEYSLVGTAAGWDYANRVTLTGTGRYLTTSVSYDTNQHFKIMADNWATNWGYDSLDSNHYQGFLARGSDSDNNNVIIAKGDYDISFDLWTDKIVISGTPFYGVIGNVASINWENDVQMVKTSGDYFVARDISMAVDKVWKIRSGGAWGTGELNYNNLLGKYDNVFWEASDHNIGIKSQGGADGTYTVVLNAKTGSISAFRKECTYAVIGIDNDWGTDHDMTWNDSTKEYSVTVDITRDNDLFKIRTDNKWGYEFDGRSLGTVPEGAFVNNGGNDNNIKCLVTGRYTIKLSLNTGTIDIVEAA